MPLFSYLFPAVKAEADEEEELVDPHVTLKEECGNEAKCAALKTLLDECNDRVASKSRTSELCVQELYDFLHCVDHCVAKDLFKKLK